MKRLAKVIKSPNDKNLYRVIQLGSNQLKCLLIKDSETKKSAAAMNVGIGSLQDPIDYQGLAHFLEHMLFMGSTKYPDESSYKKFISENGGHCNAYTSLSATNFHFEISNQALLGGLDRFAQFFISPLLLENCVERELKAVDSEATKNLKLDSRRLFQVERHISQPGCIFNKFSTGNLNTLGKPDIRDQLLKFYNQHYSADLMSLVVYSNLELDSVEQSVVEIFSGIKNLDNAAKMSYKNEIYPFQNNSISRFIKLVPKKDFDILKVKFYLPGLDHLKRYKILGYYSHLLGHESEGSLLNLLIKEGLAFSLSSGTYMQEDYFSSLTVTVKLTEKGFEEYVRVIEALAAYLQVIKTQPVQEWVYDENKRVSEMNFLYKTKTTPYSTCVTLSECLDSYEPHEVVKNMYIFEDFNSDLIEKHKNYLEIENCNIFLISKKFDNDRDCDLIEPIYQTKYSNSPISGEIRSLFKNPNISAWVSQPVQKSATSARLSDINENRATPWLGYPPRNTIIPDSFTIHKNSQKSEGLTLTPNLLLSTSNLRIRHIQVTEFNSPKVSIWLKVYSNDCNAYYSQKVTSLRRMWTLMLDETLRSFLYLAEMASSYVSASNHVNGLSINVNCFEQKIDEMLNQVLVGLIANQGVEDRDLFERFRLEQIKGLKNFVENSPSKKSGFYLDQIFIDK